MVNLWGYLWYIYPYNIWWLYVVEFIKHFYYNSSRWILHEGGHSRQVSAGYLTFLWQCRTGVGQVSARCRTSVWRVSDCFWMDVGLSDGMLDGCWTGVGRVLEGCRTGVGWLFGLAVRQCRTGFERVSDGCRADIWACRPTVCHMVMAFRQTLQRVSTHLTCTSWQIHHGNFFVKWYIWLGNVWGIVELSMVFLNFVFYGSRSKETWVDWLKHSPSFMG